MSSRSSPPCYAHLRIAHLRSKRSINAFSLPTAPFRRFSTLMSARSKALRAGLPPFHCSGGIGDIPNECLLIGTGALPIDLAVLGRPAMGSDTAEGVVAVECRFSVGGTTGLESGYAGTDFRRIFLSTVSGEVLACSSAVNISFTAAT